MIGKNLDILPAELATISPFQAAIKHRNGIIDDVNPAFCNLFGYTRDQLVNNSIFEIPLFALESASIVREELGKPTSNYEIIGIKADGSNIPLEVSSALFEVGDEKFRLAVLRNITQLIDGHLRRWGGDETVNNALIETVTALAKAVEIRDPYTAGHETTVSYISLGIGRALGMSVNDLKGLELGALVHDIGKLSIPAEILSKPGKLDPEEYELIKLHPARGARILENVVLPWPIIEMIWQHHERIDGSGYPRGLKANDIILQAKIIAVADVFDAISSHRPYRQSLGFKKSLSVLNEEAGVSLDADCVKICTSFVISDEKFTD